MAQVDAEIKGLDELIRKLSPDLVAAPVRRFMERSAILIQGKARQNVKSDTGRLANSIAYEIHGAHVPLWATVGTNLDYAAAREFQRPPGKMPPPGALVPWMNHVGIPLSEYHGSTVGLSPDARVGNSAYSPIEYLIARKIGREGSPGHPYLRPALKDSEGQITGRLLETCAREIEAAASQGVSA